MLNHVSVLAQILHISINNFFLHFWNEYEDATEIYKKNYILYKVFYYNVIIFILIQIIKDINILKINIKHLFNEIYWN